MRHSVFDWRRQAHLQVREMREKKWITVIAFATTTQAMAAEKAADEKGFPGRLIPVPREITAGCGLAWKCRGQSQEDAALFMKESRLEYEAVSRLLL